MPIFATSLTYTRVMSLPSILIQRYRRQWLCICTVIASYSLCDAGIKTYLLFIIRFSNNEHKFSNNEHRFSNNEQHHLIMNNKYCKLSEDFNVVNVYECMKEQCNSSPSTYVGYTEATLTERMRNHGQHGSIIKHLQDRHSIVEEKTATLLQSVNIIARANNKRELLLWEALKIKELQPNLNSRKKQDSIEH